MTTPQRSWQRLAEFRSELKEGCGFVTENLCASDIQQPDVVGVLSRRCSVPLCRAWQSHGAAPAMPLVFCWQKHQICHGGAVRRGWLLPRVAGSPGAGCVAPVGALPGSAQRWGVRSWPRVQVPAPEPQRGVASAGEGKLRFSIWLVQTTKSGPGCSSQARELAALPAPPGLSKCQFSYIYIYINFFKFFSNPAMPGSQRRTAAAAAERCSPVPC